MENASGERGLDLPIDQSTGDLAEPVRVLSDLHLGHSGCLVGDVAQLRPVLEGAATVVFNGDTFEERAEKFRARSTVMFAELRALCADLGVRPVFLTGNHDPGLTGDHYLDLDVGGRRVFVTHGDTLFPLVSPWSKKMDESRAAVQAINAEYSDADLADLDKRLEMTKRACYKMIAFENDLERSFIARMKTLTAELWPPRRPWAILTCWATAPHRSFQLLERHRPDAELMVFGHTHLPGVWRRRGKTVLNTGGYLAVLNARVVEFSGGETTVAKVREVGGEFRRDPAERLRW